jgi:hypothetical protein
MSDNLNSEVGWRLSRAEGAGIPIINDARAGETTRNPAQSYPIVPSAEEVAVARLNARGDRMDERYMNRFQLLSMRRVV